MRKKLEELLNEIATITSPHCPYLKCPVYHKFSRCETKTYLLCRRYTEWYDKWYKNQYHRKI